MQPLRSGALPGQRGLKRVAVRSLRAQRALDEADGLSVGYVDSGQQREDAVSAVT